VAGSWSDAEQVSGPGAEAFRPSAAVDGSGVLHVVWIDSRYGWTQIFYRRRGPEGWGPETKVTRGDYTHYHPSIVAAADRVTMIYWAAWPSMETPGVFAVTLQGDTWSGPTRISGSSSRASLCSLFSEADGRLHAAWVDERHGDPEIYYNEYLPPGTGIGGDERGQDPELPPPSLSLAVEPNPFTGSAQITVTAPSQSDLSIEVFDVAGRLVRRIAEGGFAEGLHRFEWDGQDEAGRSAPPGVYFARARSGKLTVTAKMVMAR
jgi:hypothetical protein